MRENHVDILEEMYSIQREETGKIYLPINLLMYLVNSLDSSVAGIESERKEG